MINFPAVASGRQAWPWIVSAVLVLCLIAGGTFAGHAPLVAAMRIALIAIMAVAIARLAAEKLNTRQLFAVLIAFTAVILVTLQLVPLPAALWHALPGRATAVELLRSIGADGPMPLSLSPPQTRLALLALLPGFAMFLATLWMHQSARWLLVRVLLVFTVVSVLFGLSQRFWPSADLRIYVDSGQGQATGFFGNRNHLAGLIAATIPLFWAEVQQLLQRRKVNRLLAWTAGAAGLTVIIAGLGATGSRAGIILGMLALFLSALIGWRRGREEQPRFGARMSGMLFVLSAILIAQFAMVAVLRLAATDPLSDYRSTINAVSWQTAREYFPIGSGFGTFVPVYGMNETPDSIGPSYVNHAHNDWMELAIEGGLPALIAALAFLAWFGWVSFEAWRPNGKYSGQILPRALSLSILVFLLHSCVDYPLRTPALLATFGMLCGLMAGTRAIAKPRHIRPALTRKPAVRAEKAISAPATGMPQFAPIPPRQSGG